MIDGTMPRQVPLGEFKWLIRDRGFTYAELAQIIGIPASSFSKKINGMCLFDVFEAFKLVNVLSIQSENLREYFLPSAPRIP